MTKLSIHHATAKKAVKFGVALTIEGDRIVAIDERTPDQEFSGANASELLERVLSRRDDYRPKGGADEGDGDEIEDEDEALEEDVDEAELVDGEENDEADADLDAGEADEEEEKESGSIVKPKYRQAYEVFDGTCGDAFADAFSVACRNGEGEFDVDALRGVATENGIDLDARWGHLNVGQRRMNLSNVLRGKVRRGDTVIIGRQPFEPVLGEDGKPTGDTRAVTTRGAAR